jgi:hypothetical protein
MLKYGLANDAILIADMANAVLTAGVAINQSSLASLSPMPFCDGFFYEVLFAGMAK